jgi:hypothetical protein
MQARMLWRPWRGEGQSFCFAHHRVAALPNGVLNYEFTEADAQT